jgi:hypothetical protein
MFAELITWWTEQMRDLVPASLRLSGQPWRRALIVVADPSDAAIAELFLLGRGGETALGRHELTASTLHDTIQRLPAATRLAAVLRIAPDRFLERDAVVPIAAERELNRVIGYEMDRLTPFQAGEVFWTCRITKRDTEHNRLHVRVTIVPRIRVRSILEALQRADAIRLRPDNLLYLDFSVATLDTTSCERLYNKREGLLSGLGRRPVLGEGRSFSGLNPRGFPAPAEFRGRQGCTAVEARRSISCYSMSYDEHSQSTGARLYRFAGIPAEIWVTQRQRLCLSTLPECVAPGGRSRRATILDRSVAGWREPSERPCRLL